MTIEPLLPAIVGGIRQAFSIAVSTTFQVGVVTTILALAAALAIQEIPLRRTMGEAAPGAMPASPESSGAARPRVRSVD